MNELRKKYFLLSTQLRWAFWLIAVICILFGIFAFSSTPRALTAQNYLIGFSAFIPAVLSVSAFVSMVRILTGKPQAAGMIMTLVFTVSLVFVALVVSGIGLLAAVMTLLIPSVITSLTVKGRGTTALNIFTFIAGVVIMLIDSFYPGDRVVVANQDQIYIGVLTVVTLISFLAYIAFRFHSFSLRAKLVVGFLIVSILPVAAVGFTSNYLTQHALEEDANVALLASASQVSASLDSFVQHNLDTIRAEAQLQVFRDYLELPVAQRKSSLIESQVNESLAALRGRDSFYILSYGLIDRQGINVADTNPENVGVDISDRDYFQEAVRTDLPYMSAVEVYPQLKTHVLSVSAPVHNEVGNIIGVLRVRYEASVVHQQVTQIQRLNNQTNSALVIDDHNIVLANTSNVSSVYKSVIPLDQKTLADMQKQKLLPDNAPIESLVFNAPGLASGLHGMGIQANFTADINPGEDKSSEQIGAVAMRYRPWKVLIAESQLSLTAPVVQQSRSTILAGVVVSVLAVLFGLLIAQLVSDPISRLTEVANKISLGDLTVKANAGTQDEVGVLANAFNAMTDQISGLIGTLEQRVAERTRALAVSADVSRRISTILDTDRLVSEVVTQLQAAFNFYHVQIYLFDQPKENLVMAGGTGEAGRAMLAKGHQIPRGKGLVGRAAETGQVVLVGDVTKAEGWLPNPLLSETQAEVAVPIAIGENVLGVLDVQQNQVDGLSEADTELIQSVANQVAIALQNARTLASVQHQADRETLIAAIGQRIQHTTSSEEALMVAVREIGRAIGSSNVAIRLHSKENSSGNGHNNR